MLGALRDDEPRGTRVGLTGPPGVGKSSLAAALGTATGKQVEVKVIVDPSLKGGVVAQVGDTVIDGSIRRRLDQLRNAL